MFTRRASLLLLAVAALAGLSVADSAVAAKQSLRRRHNGKDIEAGKQSSVRTNVNLEVLPDALGKDAGRPAWLTFPKKYSAKGKKWPLIMMLHGYGSDSYYHDRFLHVTANVDSHGFVAMLPNGTMNSQGRHFWNGINCCDFDHQGPDDRAYLTGLIKEAVETLNIDPKRVYMIGHSNGGAMTQILACEHAELFAAVASITPGEIPSPCNPSHPVSVLELCASEDPIVKIDLCSSIIGNWTRNDGCPAQPTFTDLRDYDCDPDKPWDENEGFNEWHGHNCRLEGAETQVTGYKCKDHSTVEFWWMQGAAHNPYFSPKFSDDMISWLLSKKYVEAADQDE